MNDVVETFLEKDELIDVKIPAGDYTILREIIEERRAMTQIKKWLQTGLLFIIGGSAILFFNFWEHIKGLLK